MTSININHSSVAGIVNSGTMSTAQVPKDQAGHPSEFDVRTIFALDLIDYRGLPTPIQANAQQDLRDLLHRVVSFSGTPLADVYVQEAGDGFICVFPPVDALASLILDLVSAVPAACARCLKGRSMRVAIGCGPTTRAELGVTGNSVVTVIDVLNSSAMRQHAEAAEWQNPSIALVQPMWDWVVGAGYLNDPKGLGEISITTKNGALARFGLVGG